MEYPKINSLWKREGWYFDEKEKKEGAQELEKLNKMTQTMEKIKRQSFRIGDYACPEFGNVRQWRVDEKVDGTNIRLIYKDGNIKIGGRTDFAQLPVHLLDFLQKTFYCERFAQIFLEKEEDPYPNVVIFGEGYGRKIQAAGGNYRSDVSFIMFDVWVNGWWLERESVERIAKGFGVDCVPTLGIWDEAKIVEYVKSKPLSTISHVPQMMEGVVCRSEPLMLFRNGKPMMWKLKTKEFI